jgi:hypothetical protein
LASATSSCKVLAGTSGCTVRIFAAKRHDLAGAHQGYFVVRQRPDRRYLAVLSDEIAFMRQVAGQPPAIGAATRTSSALTKAELAMR